MASHSILMRKVRCDNTVYNVMRKGRGKVFVSEAENCKIKFSNNIHFVPSNVKASRYRNIRFFVFQT